MQTLVSFYNEVGRFIIWATGTIIPLKKNTDIDGNNITLGTEVEPSKHLVWAVKILEEQENSSA